jgi:hypothetical protein
MRSRGRRHKGSPPKSRTDAGRSPCHQHCDRDGEIHKSDRAQDKPEERDAPPLAQAIVADRCKTPHPCSPSPGPGMAVYACSGAARVKQLTPDTSKGSQARPAAASAATGLPPPGRRDRFAYFVSRVPSVTQPAKGSAPTPRAGPDRKDWRSRSPALPAFTIMTSDLPMPCCPTRRTSIHPLTHRCRAEIARGASPASSSTGRPREPRGPWVAEQRNINRQAHTVGGWHVICSAG